MVITKLIIQKIIKIIKNKEMCLNLKMQYYLQMKYKPMKN